MERLNVGKTSEEVRHFLEVTADLEFKFQGQDLDTRDKGADGQLSPSLQFKCGRYAN